MPREIETTAKARYDELHAERSSTYDRAVLCSELTVPNVFKEENATAQDDLTREYVQGYGAKLVNHLVGKFALTLMPPSQPFFRLAPTPEALEAVVQGDAQKAFEIEKILAQKEETILRHINKSEFRKSLYPAVRIAMVTGDTLIEKIDDEKGSYKVYSMRNYVIKRDASGKIIDLLIKETINYNALPEEVQGSIDEKDRNEPIDLYTYVYLDEGTYRQFQEANEETISGSEIDLGKTLEENYISVPWHLYDGEDYGRGMVEDYLGTFISLNKQLKVVNESSAIASRTVFLVNPNGMTKYKDFVDATNGDVKIGHENDITTVKADKGNDLQYSYNLIQDYKKELAEAFLLTSASVRDAERVTAHEVQKIASELEASFGGIYTAFSSNIQMPIVVQAMSKVNIEATEDVDVLIISGVEALGRNVELQKVNAMIGELANLSSIVPPESVAQSLNVDSLVQAIISNSGVAGKNFLKSQQEQTQEIATSKEEAMAQEVMQGGLQEAGKQLVLGGQ